MSQSPDVLNSEQLSLLFTEAHTAHSFTEQAVSDETIHEIYELIKWAPTSMNNQPLRITWVRSPEARAHVVAAMAEGNREKTAGAPLVAVLSADTQWFEHFGTFAPWAQERQAFFAENSEVAHAMAVNNAHIQAGYFILAARALGLAVGPMGGFDSARVDELLNSDNGYEAFLVVNLGYPADDAFRPRNQRLDESVVVRSV